MMVQMPLSMTASSGLVCVTQRWWRDRNQELMVQTDGGETLRLGELLDELGDRNPRVGPDGMWLEDLLPVLKIEWGRVCLCTSKGHA